MPTCLRTKTRAGKVEEELSATITQKYSESVLDSTNAWEYVTADAAELEGLPESAVQAALQKRCKRPGAAKGSAVALLQQAPSVTAVMRYAHSDTLRSAFGGVAQIAASGEHDNAPLIVSILQLRRKRQSCSAAKIFADLVLKRRMARAAGRQH